jgi:hypothetical protein
METYSRKFDATITTFWGAPSLFDVKISKLSTWSLDDSDFVGPGVVAV